MSRNDGVLLPQHMTGPWTLHVQGREVSTLSVTLAADGTVTGTLRYESYQGPLTGTWVYAAPLLTLRMESRLGLRPQPLRFDIALRGGEPLEGSDDQGHHFILEKAP